MLFEWGIKFVRIKDCIDFATFIKKIFLIILRYK